MTDARRDGEAVSEGYTAAVRVLSLEEIDDMYYRWKYNNFQPTNLELECLFLTADFAVRRLEHFLKELHDNSSRLENS